MLTKDRGRGRRPRPRVRRQISRTRGVAMNRADQSDQRETTGESFALRACAALIQAALLPLWLIAIAVWIVLATTVWIVLVVLAALLSLPAAVREVAGRWPGRGSAGPMAPGDFPEPDPLPAPPA